MSTPRSFADRLVAFLFHRRKVNAWLTLLFVASFSLFASRIRFENSVESFISPEDPDRIYYDAFKDEFGDDQIIALAIPLGDVFTRDALGKIDALSRAIEDLPLVRKIKSITEAQDIVGTEESFEVLPFIDKIPEEPQELARLRASALENPLYKIDLISLDGRIASLLIEPRHGSQEDRYKQIVEQVKALLAQSPLKDREFYLAGDPLVELEMTQDMWRDLFTFVPLTYLCLMVLLFLLFRSLRVVFLLIVVISLCLGWLMGWIGAMGITMNAVTVGLPSLMVCIAMLDCIHLISLYRVYLAKGMDAESAMRESIRQNLKPCFLTSLTTAVGFGSICVSELIPIRQFGFLAACSTLAAYGISFLTMPYAMAWMSTKAVITPEGERRRLSAFFQWVGRWHRRKAWILFGSVLVIGASWIGISRIQVETNHLKFLRPDSLVKQGTSYFEKNLGGVSPLEVTVETQRDGEIKEPRVLKQIERFQLFMDSLPEVDKTVSPVQFIKEMHQAMNAEDPAYYFIPDSRELIAQYILVYSFSGRDNDLDDFVDYPYRTARIRGRISERSSAELKETLRKIQSFARTNFDEDLSVRITSHSLLQANMVDALVEGQVRGLGIGFLMMLSIIALVHRSWIVGLVSLIPNALPLLAAMGLMGFLGISLNAGTAMTACIAFGLVVDDTLHLLHHTRLQFKRGGEVPEVIQRVLEHVGPAVLYSSLLLGVGFAILMLGRSYLTVYFGGICAFTIVSALVCDLFVTPVLIDRIPAFRRALQR